MKSTVIRKGITASVILGLGAFLSACGGGGGSGGSVGGSSPANPSNTPTNNTITGYTVDGPFSASVYVYNSSGSLCGETVSSSQNGSFTVSLSPGCSSGPYLISATASSGPDAGTYYYVASNTFQNIYVTPVSTAAVEVKAGHYSISNVLAYFISNPNSLASVESQEIQYSGPSLSLIHVFLPNSTTNISTLIINNSVSSSTTPNGSYTNAEVDEYIYPSNLPPNAKNVPITIKEYKVVSSTQSPYTYMALASNTVAGLFSVSNNVLSLNILTSNIQNIANSSTGESIVNIPYYESITFSGNLNSPYNPNFTIIGFSYSVSYTYNQIINNSSSSSITIPVTVTSYIAISNGIGEGNMTFSYTATGGRKITATYIDTYTTSNPFSVATSCSAVNSSTIMCSGPSPIQTTQSSALLISKNHDLPLLDPLFELMKSFPF